ncbi:hypothetical protein EMIHUDRAFT_217836 [Emiliania huxleyi CCMP1516]|uniref:CHASE4 domain-containing protein n=2 Tax=Emiliania huxleyi TaxID=2903 RepID=A0A0D3IAE6_EMIH1|nr:hypothetical protein EMIHUDRAFT_217836 [Emiliania huxleyi CCMP1516]EOD08231.1 hypothetical protein EMIHUDRAFT_217836 [Emiliania huxleyi CCMP1516]|eukprot:XP_005760660.1 hypothetical protein EMIHUDRAFT_217836 [Emiliania huxleyi CCMP1516]
MPSTRCEINPQANVLIYDDTRNDSFTAWERQFWAWWSSEDASVRPQLVTALELRACRLDDYGALHTWVHPAGSANQSLDDATRRSVLGLAARGALFVGSFDSAALLGLFDAPLERPSDLAGLAANGSSTVRLTPTRVPSEERRAVYLGGATLDGEEQAGGQATAPPPLPPGGSVAAIFSGLSRALPAVVRVRPPEGAAHLLCSSVLLTARPRDGSDSLLGLVDASKNYELRRALIAAELTHGAAERQKAAVLTFVTGSLGLVAAAILLLLLTPLLCRLCRRGPPCPRAGDPPPRRGSGSKLVCKRVSLFLLRIGAAKGAPARGASPALARLRRWVSSTAAPTPLIMSPVERVDSTAELTSSA